MTLVSYTAVQRTEGALYDYAENKDRLDKARAEILHSTPRRAEGRQGGRTSDTTADRAIRLADLMATEWARWADCITDLLGLLPKQQRKLLELKYFERLRVRDIASQLYVSPAWYYVMQENALKDVMLYATQRGLIRPIPDKRQKV